MNQVTEGTFLEILLLLARHDPIVEHYLNNNPRNATYTSPEIQNVLLNVFGKIIRKSIASKVVTLLTKRKICQKMSN